MTMGNILWKNLAAMLAIILVAGVSVAGAQPAADQPFDPDAVDQAIQRGVEYLWSQWNGRTCWDSAERQPPDEISMGMNYGGPTAMCAYALLAAGESHQSERMQKTLEWLSKIEMRGTYALALRANVWALLPRAQYRTQLLRDVNQLMRSINQNPNGDNDKVVGGYHYWAVGRQYNGIYDNSNSQFAVLGVWAGWLQGVEVPEEYWKLVEQHWIDTQYSNGGWSYKSEGTNENRGAYGSMTAGGLATLFICFDALYGREFLNCRGEQQPEAIAKGLKWFEENFTAERNANFRDHNGRPANQHYEYYLYGVERVGLASGYKFFGQHDWYREGAAALLRRQGRNGGFGGVNDTAFSLLFLVRGRHPVLFNHLQYDGAWQNRPRALANLTRWISRTFERTVNWQIVPLNTPVEQWHDAPILYISGHLPPKFTDEQLDKLRTFAYQGGTILSITECNFGNFTKAMEKYYATMFPGCTIEELPIDHEIRSIHFKARQRYRILGVSNGVRLLAVHVMNDLPRTWQLGQSIRAGDLEIAANIYFYVTDKGSLRNRGTSMWPAESRSAATDRTIKLARLKHEGNYNPEPLAWERMGILLANHARTKLEASEPMDIGELKASEHPIAHLTGTGKLAFSAEQKASLKQYATDGGLLIIDAAGGNAEFRTSAEKMLDEIFGATARSRLALSGPVYKLSGNEIPDAVKYRRATEAKLGSDRRPRLQGVELNGRIVCIYSAEDLTAGMVGYEFTGVDGYAPATKVENDSAYQIVRNILLWATTARSSR